MTLHEKIDDVRMRQLETLLTQQSEQIEQLRRILAKVDS